MDLMIPEDTYIYPSADILGGVQRLDNGHVVKWPWPDERSKGSVADLRLKTQLHEPFKTCSFETNCARGFVRFFFVIQNDSTLSMECMGTDLLRNYLRAKYAAKLRPKLKVVDIGRSSMDDSITSGASNTHKLHCHSIVYAGSWIDGSESDDLASALKQCQFWNEEGAHRPAAAALFRMALRPLPNAEVPNIFVSASYASTGAASGLGAAFVEAYQDQPAFKVLALDRKPIVQARSNVRSFTVDMTSETSLATFSDSIQDLPIDLLIHSAGIRGLVPSIEAQQADNVAACETLQVMDINTLTQTFAINAAGTFALLRALLPNLRLSALLAKVVVMSSRMGSIGNNQVPNKDAGSAYAYRASKAAVNAMIRSFAVDVPEVTFVLCHPGRVQTNLVKCVEEGAIDVRESVAGMLPLIEQWGEKNSGKFYDRFGEVIQW
nr:c-factor [Quercus suber]